MESSRPTHFGVHYYLQETMTRLSCTRGLELIAFKVYIDTTQSNQPLICLRYRRAARSKLKHLKIIEYDSWAYKVAEDIRPLVEVLEINFLNRLQQKVFSVSITGPNVCQLTFSGGVITCWKIMIEFRVLV